MSFVLGDVKPAELPTAVLNQKNDIFMGGVKTYYDPPTYFQGVKIPNPLESMPLCSGSTRDEMQRTIN